MSNLATRPSTKRFNAASVAPLFPEAEAQANLARYLPVVLSALHEEGVDHPALVLLALATIRAESAGFAPIDEYPSAWNTAPGGKAFALYDHRHDLGNQGAGDGETYRGRGFIQLTRRDNYQRYGDRLGVDLIHRPELANDPEVAAHLLALFIKDREQALLQAYREGDLPAARALINGGRHGLDVFRQTMNRGQQLIADDAGRTVASTRSSCDTGAISGLSQQVLNELGLDGHLIRINHPLINGEGDQNNPWLQPAAYRDLVRAVNERGRPLRINSALRTPMQQHLLHQQWRRGECGISVAARPPWSQHNSGLAIDIEDAPGWRPYLEQHGWRWLGPHDPMHFDYVRGGIDLGAEQVRAYQRLWNRHHPQRPLVVDGLWGPATEAAVNRSPAAGFGHS